MDFKRPEKMKIRNNRLSFYKRYVSVDLRCFTDDDTGEGEDAVTPNLRFSHCRSLSTHLMKPCHRPIVSRVWLQRIQNIYP